MNITAGVMWDYMDLSRSRENRYLEYTDMKKVLLYVWQLPQNLIGLLLRLFWKTEFKIEYKDKTIRVCSKFPSGISLGETILLKNAIPVDIKHEYGHTRQSLYLGPLYLFVIGIPSILWAATYKLFKKDYYTSFYTEIWADKLGGVKRQERH